MPERRPARFKTCPIEGCDHRLVTAEFVGGPDTIEEVPVRAQMEAAGLHMRTHYTHDDGTVIDLGRAGRADREAKLAADNAAAWDRFQKAGGK